MKKTILVTAATLIALGLAGCASNETPPTGPTGPASATTADTPTSAAPLTGTLNAGGSSAQTAAQEAWRAGFQSANPAVTVNYDPTGSGTGRTNFSDGGYLFAGTDAAFDIAAAAGPFAACATGSALVEVPAYISAIAIGFTLPGITSLNLDANTVAAIFAQKITVWNDPAIAALNPGVTLPATAIDPVHRSDQSGTTQNFTDYLSKAAPSVWTWPAAQTWPTDLTGDAAQGTQGVGSLLGSTPGSIGYIDESQSTGLGIVSVGVGSNFTPPSSTAAAAAVGKSPLETGRAASDIVVALDRTLTDAGTYPVVLVSYVAACQQYADPANGALVKAYLTYVISDAGQQAAAGNAGSSPLSPDLSAKATQAVSTIS